MEQHDNETDPKPTVMTLLQLADWLAHGNGLACNRHDISMNFYPSLPAIHVGSAKLTLASDYLVKPFALWDEPQMTPTVDLYLASVHTTALEQVEGV